MFKAGNKVKVKRDIYRMSNVINGRYTEEVLYSKEGEVGEIIEIFYPPNSSAGAASKPHAKVSIQNEIKTFRLTSIEKIQ